MSHLGARGKLQGAMVRVSHPRGSPGVPQAIPHLGLQWGVVAGSQSTQAEARGIPQLVAEVSVAQDALHIQVDVTAWSDRGMTVNRGQGLAGGAGGCPGLTGGDWGVQAGKLAQRATLAVCRKAGVSLSSSFALKTCNL